MKIIQLGKSIDMGGKAGALNKLYCDFNIARGFIIKYDVFCDFLRLNHISLTDDIVRIKTEIMKGIFPQEKELLNYYKSHNFDKVIVRSSAFVEDGDKYSFAGQFDSFTNTDIDTLILNIKKCWVSMFHDHVIAYLESNHLEHDFSFDVLIQEMILSDLSGIAFSVNPTNGKEEQVIHLTNLQCEELVSGRVIPHMYTITNEICGDEFIGEDILKVIADSLQKLKNILKKDVEIEFCLKNNQFYLFQVRPITKIYFSLCNYIYTEFWCSFKNNNFSLFHRSLWILGATKYKNKKINNKITEDITLYYPYNEKQIRAFNGNQPPLDEATIKNHSSCDINSYIRKYNHLSGCIKRLSLIIRNHIDKNNFELFYTYLKILIRNHAMIYSYEYLIGSLGQALYDRLDRATIKSIENWRNSEDNSYFKIYDDIFRYVVYYFNMDMDIKKIEMYIHVSELLDLCDQKISFSTLLKRIRCRERNGFVILNLHNKKYNNRVITDKSIFDAVKKRFSELQNNLLEENQFDGIKGHSTFKNGKIIIGECIVVKNNTIDTYSAIDLENKILICEVTTAQDIKYLKKVKALIVNNGGILCHSAIFSREFCIPCLMGCEVATHYFHTGDVVLFDVDHEFIRKVDKKN